MISLGVLAFYLLIGVLSARVDRYKDSNSLPLLDILAWPLMWSVWILDGDITISEIKNAFKFFTE